MNVAGLCPQFRVDILNGLHAFSTSILRAVTTKDVYKAALYLATGNLTPAINAYTATDEVSGTNYTAGGAVVPTATPPVLSGTTALFTPSAPVAFPDVTLSASFNAAMIYNDTTPGKPAVGIVTFTPQTVIAGTFSITMPANDIANALVRIGP